MWTTLSRRKRFSRNRVDLRLAECLLSRLEAETAPVGMKSLGLISVTTLSFLCVARLAAVEEGTGGIVREVNGDIARVDFAGPSPEVGDKAEFFFEIADVEGVITVATGKVLSLDGKGSMQVKIEEATGQVAKDQLVRFSKPGARKTVTPAPKFYPRR